MPNIEGFRSVEYQVQKIWREQSSPFTSEEELEMRVIQNGENKKENVEMWDNLDALAINFVRELQNYGLSGENLDEHQLLDTAKSVLEAVLPVVEKATGKEFEFVATDF